MTRDDQDTRVPRSISLALVPAAVVLVLLLTAVALWLLHPDRQLPVLATDIAAGHRITRADLAAKPKSVSGYGLGEVATRNGELAGHVTETALRAGEPVPLDSVTASAAPAAFPKCTLLRFRTTDATTLDVRTGSLVKLMFAPIVGGAVPGPGAVDAVLIDATTQGDVSVYFVAVAPTDVAALLARVGRSRLLVGQGVTGRRARGLCLGTPTQKRPHPQWPSNTRRHCHHRRPRPENGDWRDRRHRTQ
jgi:hypothetical protein